MSENTFKRYERKYMLNSEQFEKLLPRLLSKMDYDEYSSTTGYDISNIYFDTDDNSVIRHSTNKPYYKEKVRIRCYGEISNDDCMSFLEVKRKTGGIVSKRRAKLTLKEIREFVKFGTLPKDMDYITAQVMNEMKYAFSILELHPKVFLSYHRIALHAKDDSGIRVTFDNNILSRHEDLDFTKGLYGENILESGNYLMEIKVSDAVPLWLTKELSNLSIRRQSFSKYGTDFTNSLKGE